MDFSDKYTSIKDARKFVKEYSNNFSNSILSFLAYGIGDKAACNIKKLPQVFIGQSNEIEFLSIKEFLAKNNQVVVKLEVVD